MNVICFHNPDEENGYLSNWYLSDFTLNGLVYSSMEQYMMRSKAVLFHDYETAERIMSTSDVSIIKKLGREVKNFSNEVWDYNKCAIITEGLKAKFICNQTLLQRLLNTGDSILVECAVRDKIWGAGVSMKDPDRFYPSKWKGQNLLGQCLMTVRDFLRSNYYGN